MRTKLLPIIALSFMAVSANAQVFFTQNFDGKTLANITSSTPDATQFNGVGTFVGTNNPPDDAATISIANDQAVLAKSKSSSSTGAAYLSRTTDMGAETQFIVMKFDMDITTASAATSALSLQFGNNFTADYVNESGTSSAATTFAFRINFNAVATNSFLVRANANTNGVANYSGNQTVRVFMNQTETSREYTGPDGSTGNIVAKNTFNVWVGNVKQYANNLAVTNAGVEVSNFKFILTGGPLTLKIDNISFTALEGTLPVSLSSFTGKLNGNATQLDWKTQSEQNNSHFDILRSTDGKVFELIGTKAGNGTTQQVSNYSFTEKAPLAGVIYYKLRQVDFDGKSEEFGPLAVESFLQSDKDLKAYLTNDGQLVLQVNAAKPGSAAVRITNIAGQKISESTINLNQGEKQFFVPANNLVKGIHVVTVQNGEFVQQVKFIK